MKSLLFLAIFWSFQALATGSYGMYLFETKPEWGSAESVTFVMNSSAEVKEIEDEYYFSIKSSMFFTEVTLDLRSGGDEEYFLARAVLGEKDGQTVLLNYCAALIYGPSGIANTIGPSMAKLSKWNKRTKKYDDLAIVASEKDISNCEKELLRKYSNLGFEIYEY